MVKEAEILVLKEESGLETEIAKKKAVSEVSALMKKREAEKVVKEITPAKKEVHVFQIPKKKKNLGSALNDQEKEAQKKNLVQTNVKNQAKVNLKLLVSAEEKVQNAQDQEENKFNYRIE